MKQQLDRVTGDMETALDSMFLDSLVGPFAMRDAPAYTGFYAVQTKIPSTFEMWYWDGREWGDDDDGLSIGKDAEGAFGWYGQRESQ